MTFIYFFILIAVFFLIFRLWVLFKTNKFSVDQNFWLLYRLKAREQKRIPPNIDNYILDVKQWYPPIFGWIIKNLPKKIILKPEIFVIVLNVIRLGIAGFFVLFGLQKISPLMWIIISLIFLSAPILSYYENQINSRVFGAITLDLIVLFWSIFFETNFSVYLFIIFALTIILMFSHKMSLQLYICIIIGISFYQTSLIPIILSLISLIISLLFLGYSKYLRAHIEIVKFWQRNCFKLGSHQFYESELYGSKDFIYKNRIHGGGFKTFKKKFTLLLAMFPMIIIWVVNFELNFLSVIIITTLVFILITTFVKYFYSLGYGLYYEYNLVSFVCFYFVINPFQFSKLNLFFFIFSLILSFLSIMVFIKRKNNINTNLCLNEVIQFLKNSKLDRLLIFPFQLPDEIAYKTNKKVFWGAHGLGFLWIENYFPVMKVKIEEVISDWNLGAIILEKKYWPEFFNKVDQENLKLEFENENYCILSVLKWSNQEKTPVWALKKYPNLTNN